MVAVVGASKEQWWWWQRMEGGSGGGSNRWRVEVVVENEVWIIVRSRGRRRGRNGGSCMNLNRY